MAKSTERAGTSEDKLDIPPEEAIVTEAADDSYLPRDVLTAPPSLTDPVFISFPEEGPPGQWRAIVTLFIDANGQVRHVRMGTPSIPAVFEAAARSAFLGVRFNPGEVDGHRVRSRIRVEVEFSDAPLPGT